MSNKKMLNELVVIKNLQNHYELQPNVSLELSVKENGGLTTPIVVNEKNEIIDGYRRVQVCQSLGFTSVDVIVQEGVVPSVQEYTKRNLYREKTTWDKIKDIKTVFDTFPKRQGKKSDDGAVYVRDEKISEALNGRWKGDKTIGNLEFVFNNDVEGDVLKKGIVEQNWKVEPCYEFLTKWKDIDETNNFGMTRMLLEGENDIKVTNRLIEEKEKLVQGHEYTFVIPEKVTLINDTCEKIDELFEEKIDLQLCSVPYWNQRNYVEGGENQLGHEKTKEEYIQNLVNIFKKLDVVMKETGNVLININDTFIKGEGQCLPFLLCTEIIKQTGLKYKKTFIWSKKNAKPENEFIDAPQNSFEYILWFIKNPLKHKYKELTFYVEGKKAELSRGVKDVNKDGRVNKRRKGISKDYGKLLTHLKEQQVEDIITTSVGTDGELRKIISSGHPAPMSPWVPVTLGLMLSDENDLCCDIFGGSQVSGKIFTLLNRRYVSTELSKEYFNIGKKRIQNALNDFDRDGLDEINKLVYTTNDQVPDSGDLVSNQIDDNLNLAA